MEKGRQLIILRFSEVKCRRKFKSGNNLLSSCFYVSQETWKIPTPKMPKSKNSILLMRRGELDQKHTICGLEQFYHVLHMC